MAQFGGRQELAMGIVLQAFDIIGTGETAGPNDHTRTFLQPQLAPNREIERRRHIVRKPSMSVPEDEYIKGIELLRLPLGRSDIRAHPGIPTGPIAMMDKNLEGFEMLAFARHTKTNEGRFVAIRAARQPAEVLIACRAIRKIPEVITLT